MYSYLALYWIEKNSLKWHVYDHLRAWSMKIQESCKNKHGIKIHSPETLGKTFSMVFQSSQLC